MTKQPTLTTQKGVALDWLVRVPKPQPKQGGNRG